MEANEALLKYFGFDRFRQGQEEIVRSVTSRRDTLVVMPTGGGKSLCYQLPALLLPGATLVISPLIALMKDQVDALRARGIEAETINSTLSPAEQDERIEGLREGRFKLLYVAPERFGQHRFVDALRRANVSLVAVDEAHCVSQWGHDFRPDYLKIGRAVRQIGNVPVAAFTATATPDVREDIVRHLDLHDPAVFVTGFARPNLSFSVIKAPRKRDKFAHLRKLVAEQKTGIIYCSTRKHVEAVFEEIEAWGTRVIAYHAGMDDEARSHAQDRFISGKADVAVATNAFGMGIDRADIRFVAHYEMPGSVEAYYQEAGRAGRDGLPACCDFLYSYADKRTQEFFIDGANPGLPTVLLLWEWLRRNMDAQGEVRLSVGAIAEELDIKNEMTVGSAMTELMRARYVERFDIPGKRMKGTRLLRPDLAASQLEIDAQALVDKEQRDRNRLQAVIDFAESRSCRQEWMLHYFGDRSAHSCGRCDWCLRNERKGVALLNDDQFTILRMALSGVARMSRRHGPNEWEGLFGVGRICEMLCGKYKGPMREHGLDKLSTFGLLKEAGEEFTRALLDECLTTGLLRKSQDERPVVTLTQLGTETMRGDYVPTMCWPDSRGQIDEKRKKPEKTKRFVVDDADPTAARTAIDEAEYPRVRKKAKRRSGLFDDDDPEAPDFEQLLDDLKKRRMEIAQKRHVRAYMIFPDKTLEAIARARPLTPEKALLLPGIGPGKANREFPAFVDVIQRFN